MEAEAAHRGIGAESRKAEEVPGAADAMTGLENGEGPVRHPQAEEMRGVDARDACADDEDVVVFDIVGRHVGELLAAGCFAG